MPKSFESTMYLLLGPSNGDNAFSILDPTPCFDMGRDDPVGQAQTLNGAFLIALAGSKHPLFEQAMDFLKQMLESPQWGEVARFFLNGIDLIHEEVDHICEKDHTFATRLNALSQYLSNNDIRTNHREKEEQIWSVFFPEANNIWENKDQSIQDLRSKRMVTIKALNASPIKDPAREILFTSNVLLTIPSESVSLDQTDLSDHLKSKLSEISEESQIYWYDHPIQIGVPSDQNEILYGLKGLEEAFAFERECGHIGPDSKPICVLSVSVTHKGLHGIAKNYLEEILKHASRIKDMDLYVFTEEDTWRIVNEILEPAVWQYLSKEDGEQFFEIFGVDGEYGRHYNFLKAIAVFWSVFIQSDKRATFKIDLDQVFPQRELKEQTDSTAFEHLMTPLWGGEGLDAQGRPLEMGMIAGALVNEKDIHQSLFTPDVPFPNRDLFPYEYFFYSTLPQALSTEAEMMARYNNQDLDGQQKCIQRYHVTGGTNGIMIDSLRRLRPFTPSFIGRAEDQAYILSVLLNEGRRLAYVHKDGLIMRHDKEAFAQEAIQSAHIGKLLGDYIRVLYFSAYSKVLDESASTIKEEVDPFTGCFISKIPITIVYLRFGLQAASLFFQGKHEQGIEFIQTGVRRLQETLDFVKDKKGNIQRQFQRERFGWDLYYDVLSAVEDGLRNNDSFAQDLKKKALDIIEQCKILG